MIFVITRYGDLHGQHILNLLMEKGEDALPLDYSDFPKEMEISFNPEVGTVISYKGRHLLGSEIRSVLYRREADPKPAEELPESVSKYIVRESKSLLDSLSTVLSSYWFSKPDSIKTAGRKTFQMLIARQVGFKVPPTLVSNSPKQAESFIRDLKADVALKPLLLSGFQIHEDNAPTKAYAFFTKRLSAEQIVPSLQKLSNCPVIIQKYVEKAYELRITVVGNQVFPCAIYSQESPKTIEDWRNYDLKNTPHKAVKIPVQVELACVDLVKKLDLQFGCIDMIVTPEGDYFFLEINPNGQWLWIEDLTNLPISEAIANALS